MKMICLNIDATNVNTILTIVSIVLTAISIGCTISTVIMMFRTKKIKTNMMEKLNSYSLVSYIDRINSLYLEFSKQILPTQWDKVTSERFINLLNEIEVELRRINEHKDYMSESNFKQINENIIEAKKAIEKFSEEINEELLGEYHHLHNFPLQRSKLLDSLNKVDEELQSIRSEWMTK